MMDNHLYNLMCQLTEESKSLQRIKSEYQADHGGCDKCGDFWKKMEEDKEAHIGELCDLIKEHMQ